PFSRPCRYLAEDRGAPQPYDDGPFPDESHHADAVTRRRRHSPLKMRSIRWIGYVALVLGFAQVVFGAIVRITGSGMGCGDHWPECYGAFTPTHDAATLLVELSHRYGAAALSIAIFALAAVAWSKRSDLAVAGAGGVLRPSLLAILLVVIAAL